MAELRPHADDLARHARLAVIGSGSPAMARDFRERSALPASLELYTDPQRASFAAAGLARSAWLTLSPPALIAHVAARLKGHPQGKIAGDPWQQGGAALVGTDGRVRWRFRSLFPGHRPGVNTLCRIVTKSA